MINVLYIHGMGGGADSRIPSILQEEFYGSDICVVAKTYDFDPEIASIQITEWVEYYKPSLIIGESLGSLHAIRIKGVPHLFVSPALNTPIFFEMLAWFTLIPGVTWIYDRIYKPKEGDRQKLHFTFRILRKYLSHWKTAMANSSLNGNSDYFHAFIGTKDHYRKSGIVSVRTWEKYFGKTYSIYDGTHFMEEQYVRNDLKRAVIEVLNKK